jgi:hypothetical protein
MIRVARRMFVEQRDVGVRAVEVQLGVAAFRRAFDEGRAMDTERAIDLSFDAADGVAFRSSQSGGFVERICKDARQVHRVSRLPGTREFVWPTSLHEIRSNSPRTRESSHTVPA